VPPLPDGNASVIVERGASGRPEIALTFDAGEGPGYTAEILDVLDHYGISGSFGVTGQWAEKNPELLRRIVNEGHMLINHTYDHRSWTGESTGTAPLTAPERREEVDRTDAIIRSLTGYDPAPYFRFPYGDYDRTSLEVLHDAGYDVTLWYTCDTLAWNGATVDQIAVRCGTGRLGAGDIVLMHVVQPADYQALPVLIQDYLAHGYELVTMEELIQP
jgi:peptidoglycan/xylan/chitin deacetylase (PgdA/CDA1 family)